MMETPVIGPVRSRSTRRPGAFRARATRVVSCALLVFVWGGCEQSDGGATGGSLEASVIRPTKMGHEQIAGGIFDDYEPVVEQREVGDQRWMTEDVESFISGDRKFDAGMYRSGPVRMEIDEPYGVDEFMYFLEGSVILTSTDGSQLTIGAGDAVSIPKEWTGVWDTPEGYMKIYVIHYPEPLE